MGRIPLIRVSQCFPFLQFLKQIGSPTEKLLKQAHIPLFKVDHSNSLIPKYSLYTFIEQAARFEGIEDFGLQVGIQNDLEDLGLLGHSLLRFTTLSDIINYFIKNIRWHSSDTRFWLKSDREEAWFCCQSIQSIKVGFTHSELYTLIYMIQIVQQVTGAQWQPTKVYLQMNPMPSLHNYSLLGQAQIFFNQKFSAIAFPRHLLQQKRQEARLLKFSSKVTGNIEAISYPANDFSVALTQTIETLLSYKATNIDLVAKLTGLSTRSLQRQLAQEGINYSNLLEAVRRQKAIALLKDSTHNLTDIAQKLGYSDSANFSRAFKRWTNVSPLYFRQQNIS